VYGQVLVAPTAHREQVSGDFTLHQFLALLRVVYAVAEAVRLALRPERIYVLSLGSQQGNAHVQWQIVPCPPGLPPDQQQWALVDGQQQGLLRLDEAEETALVARLRDRLPPWMRKE
jgi:hypothetical protein